MKNKVLFILMALLLVGSLVLSACSPADTTTEEETTSEEGATTSEEETTEEEATTSEQEEETGEKTKISFVDVTGYYTLDIFGTPWFTLSQAAMYDALVITTLENDGYTGVLADSWEVAEDGLSVTFYLKEGVTFHDGTPWNADACVWNLEKYLDPEWPKEINQTWVDTVTSIEKVDDMTVVMNFPAPNATIFADLYITYMVSPTAYEELGMDNFGLDPVGTGAWIPVEIVPNDHLLFEKNPDYTWGPDYTSGGPAKIDQLEIKFIPDEAVAFASLETGEASFINLPAQFLVNARENEDIMVQEGVGTELLYLGINWTKEIYTIPEFRQAIAHAIEREEIVLAAFEGEAVGTAQFIPAGIPGYFEETEQYALDKNGYDPEMSNQILDELGWVDTNGDGIRERDGEELVFPFNFFTDEASGRAAEVIQGQLMDVGIMLELGPMEAAAQSEMLVAEQHEFFIRGYGYPDPVILSWMTYYPNRNALNNEEATALAADADQTMDFESRLEKMDVLNRWMIDNNAWFPLWTPKVFSAYRSDLKGLIFDVNAGLYFLDAYFE